MTAPRTGSTESTGSSANGSDGAGSGDREPDQPFRARSESTVWEGRKVRVVTVEVEGPDGTSFSREVLRHPGAVAVVPLHDDGTVTLLHQYRAPLDRGVWEIPAGLRDVDDEPPELTAERELIEEAGLATTRLRPLAEFHNSPGHSDELLLIYVATGLNEVPDDRQGPEEQHMEVRRLPLADAVAMVEDGRITDAKTVIALLRVAAERGV